MHQCIRKRSIWITYIQNQMAHPEDLHRKKPIKEYHSLEGTGLQDKLQQKE
jgi:hypothetical protein